MSFEDFCIRRRRFDWLNIKDRGCDWFGGVKVSWKTYGDLGFSVVCEAEICPCMNRDPLRVYCCDHGGIY